MLRREWILLTLLFFPLSDGVAQSSRVKGIQIVERGVYQAETVKRTQLPGSMVVVNTVQNVRLISSTTIVFGQIGVRFGLRYVPLGDTPGAEAPLKFVITFPPGGLRNPETKQIFFRTENSTSVPIGTAAYWEYHFENEWEIVPGIWTFSFWQQERKLAEQRFCVLELLKGPDPKSGQLPQECTTGLMGDAMVNDKPS